MSQLPADSSSRRGVPTTGAAGADSRVPPAEVGGGRRAPAAAQPEGSRGGPTAEARGEPDAAAGDAAAAAARGGRMAEARGGGPAAARGGPMAAAAAAARDARMAEVARLLGEPLEEEAPESRPRSRSGNAGALAALPYLRLRHPLSVLGINYQQFLRHYLENYPIAPGRIQELEERRRRFVEACRAREAAFDAEYQRNPQRVDFDILTFTIALTASEVINPLIEELGCDKFINRE
ncbi:EP300-interacting inhibitor of differentiation 2 [Thomomys bottae]